MDNAIRVSDLHAHRPWWGICSTPERIREPDPPEQIDKCLNCPHEECTNCLEFERKSACKRNERFMLAEPYVKFEVSRFQLAKEIGVHPDTILLWAKRYRKEMAKQRQDTE